MAASIALNAVPETSNAPCGDLRKAHTPPGNNVGRSCRSRRRNQTGSFLQFPQRGLNRVR
jgi:hypothetical protein